MALKLITENHQTKLVGIEPVRLGSYAEVVALRATIRVSYSVRALDGEGRKFLPVMDSLPSFMREDIEALRARKFERRLATIRGMNKREPTAAEIAEIKARVYAPVRCQRIAIGWPLTLVMPQGMKAKSLSLGTVSDIRIHNTPPRPR